MTPPNNGPIYLPPHLEQMMYSSSDGSGPAPQQQQQQPHGMFNPGFGGFQPPTDRSAGHHPALQHFGPMPAAPTHPRHGDYQRGLAAATTTEATTPPAGRQGAAEERPSQAGNTGGPPPRNNPRLREITFFVDDDAKEAKQALGKSIASTTTTSSDGPSSPTSVPPQTGAHGGATDQASGPPHPAATPSPSPLQLYAQKQFLNDKLADVRLVLIDPVTRESEVFPAHSFVLGRSDKLYELVRQAAGKPDDATPARARSTASSWAGEMESSREPHDRGRSRSRSRSFPVPPVRASYSARGNTTTITFEASVDRDSFLLVLKTLYGAPDWELDAFLDPSHPSHRHRHRPATAKKKAASFADSGFGDAIAPPIHHVPLSPLSLLLPPPSASTSPSSPSSSSPSSPSSSSWSSPSSPSSPSSSEPEGLSSRVRMLERAIRLFSAGALLGVDSIVETAIGNIKHCGLDFHGGAFERLMKFLLQESEGLKNDKALASPCWDFTAALLDKAIELFASSIAHDFKLDKLAPNSKHLNRLGNQAISPQVTSPPPAPPPPPPPGLAQPKRMTRQAQSTILISLPFDIMKRILEHDTLASNGRKRLFDLASSVVQERERRRKRELKAIQDLIDKKTAGRSESGGDSASDILSSDCYPDVLCWEESAVSTFGHGPASIEIARRRKGGPGGRMLWKVGNRAS